MENWIEDAVFYQIYPLGFCGAPRFHQEEITHSITKIMDWIPHLKKLNVNALYLGPVFESYEHGYDTSDYRMVDHRLGDNSDFKKVCDALHDAGIHIVLDGVFNHTGRYFWAFQDVQKNREASPYCDWFSNLRFDCDNTMHDGFCYDTWQGYHNLVKLNLRNEDVISYLLDSISMWIDEYHIDGLRLDAADVMDRDFFRRLKTFTHSKNENFWLMGEIIHGNYTVWANNEMLDSVTNYECYKGLYSSHNDHNYFEIGHSLNRQFGKGGIYEYLRLYNFVDNHDVNRLASTLKDKADLINIYTLLYTMPGIPSLYYGSEWALEGIKHDGSDADIRPCLAIEDYSDIPLTKHIARLGGLRHQRKVLYYGSYESILLKNEQFVFLRRHEQELIYVALNVSDEDVICNFDCDAASLYDLLHEDVVPVKDGKAILTLPAKDALIMVACETPAEEAEGEKESVQTLEKEMKEPHITPPQPKEEHMELPVHETAIPIGRYEHFKGNHYTVLYIATHSETLESYVVYRQLYGDEGVWVRPLSMFCETVEQDGKKIPRFRYIGE